MSPILEILLLGTGTSAQTPAISCLTAPPGQGCAACLSTLTLEGKRNIRRNTSVLVKVEHHQHLSSPHPDTPPLTRRNILIDAGKSFCEAAREHFPKNEVRRLDAVLLTHPHADAINGLDDLRAWTLKAAIQPTIDIYCNAFTLKEVEKTFKYMVDTRHATGGGDVPSFQWHVFEDNQPFELFGLQITPILVHHGCFHESDQNIPYTCTAFMFDQSFLYMADVSDIPEPSWDLIDSILDRDQQPNGHVHEAGVQSHDNSDVAQKSLPASTKTRLPLFIVDTLSLSSQISHFGLGQAVVTAKRIRAFKTYLVGFSHRIHHDAWVAICEAISSDQVNGICTTTSSTATKTTAPTKKYDELIRTALMSVRQAEASRAPGAEHEKQEKTCWIRPGFDGLRLVTDGHTASDDAY